MSGSNTRRGVQALALARQMAELADQAEVEIERKTMMKTTLAYLIMAGLTMAGAAAYAGNTGWLTDFDAAKKASSERNIPILASFSGSDWCPWCMKLDREVFASDAFNAYARDHLVLFQADFPASRKQDAKVARQNQELSARYQVDSFPTVLLLDKNGKALSRTGYRTGGAARYVKHLEALVGSVRL